MSSSAIETDGRTVWVHAPDGSCIGRFSAFGIDIHKTGSEQMETGTQCLFCVEGVKPFARRPDRGLWLLFVEKMKELYGIEVPIDTITQFEDA